MYRFKRATGVVVSLLLTWMVVGCGSDPGPSGAVYMPCGLAASNDTAALPISKATISFHQHPVNCDYSPDGSFPSEQILENITWTSWGGETARGVGYLLDHHDQDNNGIQRHKTNLTLGGPVKNNTDGRFYYSTMNLDSIDRVLSAHGVPLVTGPSEP